MQLTSMEEGSTKGLHGTILSHHARHRNRARKYSDVSSIRLIVIFIEIIGVLRSTIEENYTIDN